MIETSLISLNEAIINGQTLSKGQKVFLPIGGEATIYGFVVTENKFLDSAVDMPALGEATVLSNRVIFCLNKQLYRFPIFNDLCRATNEKYKLYLLYIPRLLDLPYHSKSYIQSMRSEIADSKVAKIPGVKIEDNIAYYYPDDDDLYFQSSSKLCGLGKGFAVITRRLSKLTDDIKYEIFNSNEIMIEKE